jgi:phosphatidylglycerol:prolipoprotein diacylglycerol transferase
LVEFVREPDQQLAAFASATGLHMGQWLCVPMVFAGFLIVLRATIRPPASLAVSDCPSPF